VSEKHNTILVIEDDQMTRDVVRRHLERASYQVALAVDGKDGLQKVFDVKPDLVILDITMPHMDGFMVCKRIRELSTVPIIMLTARSEPEEIVKGLELGADDYIPKPFNKDVLLARTKANLRRALEYPPMPAEIVVETEVVHNDGLDYDDGHLAVDFTQRRVMVDDKQVRLSPTEFRLLQLLIQEAPRVLPYRTILENVWGFEYIDDINYLRVYIWHVRNKIEVDPKAPSYIINELSLGYRFEPKTDN
jgi:DNA-binding response OmpR family regulator